MHAWFWEYEDEKHTGLTPEFLCLKVWREPCKKEVSAVSALSRVLWVIEERTNWWGVG